jgi:hypothetical protein
MGIILSQIPANTDTLIEIQFRIFRKHYMFENSTFCSVGKFLNPSYISGMAKSKSRNLKIVIMMFKINGLSLT